MKINKYLEHERRDSLLTYRLVLFFLTLCTRFLLNIFSLWWWQNWLVILEFTASASTLWCLIDWLTLWLAWKFFVFIVDNNFERSKIDNFSWKWTIWRHFLLYKFSKNSKVTAFYSILNKKISQPFTPFFTMKFFFRVILLHTLISLVLMLFIILHLALLIPLSFSPSSLHLTIFKILCLRNPFIWFC